MALKNMGNLQIASNKKLKDFVLANQRARVFLKNVKTVLLDLQMNFIQQSIIFQDYWTPQGMCNKDWV